MELLKVMPLVWLLAACEPVVDGAYRGEPVFSFEGELVQYEGLAGQGHEFRVTLLWLSELEADPATQGPRLDTAIEQGSAAVELAFPSSFRVDIFAPPEPRMWFANELAIALVVVYEDRNGDGRLTLEASPSELVGGAPYEALVYAGEGAGQGPFESAPSPGFQLVRLPLYCGAALSPCATPLGAACESDAACAPDGVCLKTIDGIEWPGGACAIVGETVTCEPPADAGLYVGLDDASWWVEGCELDADCRAGYRCDVLGLGCVPEAAAFASSPPRRAAASCGVELGAPCAVDADCGAGVCLLRSNGESFRGGYCALPLADAACTPVGGQAIPWDFRPDGADTHWFLGCERDTDCRLDEGYVCDLAYEACLPTTPVELELGPGYRPPPICYGRPDL